MIEHEHQLSVLREDLQAAKDKRIKELESDNARLEYALKEIIADCESNWISAQMIAGIARKALKEGGEGVNAMRAVTSKSVPRWYTTGRIGSRN